MFNSLKSHLDKYSKVYSFILLLLIVVLIVIVLFKMNGMDVGEQLRGLFFDGGAVKKIEMPIAPLTR